MLRRGPVAVGYQHLPGLWPPEPQAAEAAFSGPGTSAAAPGRYSARPPERPERTIVNLSSGSEHGNRTHNSKAGIPYSMRNRHGSSDREPPARSTHQGTPWWWCTEGIGTAGRGAEHA